MKLDSNKKSTETSEVYALLDVMKSIKIKESELEQKENQRQQYAKIKK